MNKTSKIMKEHRHTLSLTRSDYALVMACLTDYVDILDSPMNGASFILDEDKDRLLHITRRMMMLLSKPVKSKRHSNGK